MLGNIKNFPLRDLQLAKYALLTALLTLILAPSPSSAQSGYSITTTKLESDAVVVASNSAGWLVTEVIPRVDINSSSILTLRGPSNYRRDISGFAPAASADETVSAASVTAIDKTGAVYFEQSLYAAGKNKGKTAPSHVGYTVNKLSLDSSSLTSVLTYRSQYRKGSFSHQINGNGDYLQFDSKTQNGSTALTLNKELNGVKSSLSVNLPGKHKGRNSDVWMQLTNSGEFGIFRVAKLSAWRRVITAICSGHLASSEFKCMSEDKLAEIDRAQFPMQITSAEIQNDYLTLVKYGPKVQTLTLLRADTLQIRASFSVPSWIGPMKMAITSDGSLAAILNKDKPLSRISNPYDGTKRLGIMTISQQGEKRKFSCTLENKVLTRGIGYLHPMENGKLMLTVRGARADSSTTSLLTLTPSASQITAPEGTPGICVPVS
jgi:hypothetical protein